MHESTRLQDLKPGEMFRRPAGTYRYVVSPSRTEKDGNVSVFCYNLDGESHGYWMRGGQQVERLPLPSKEGEGGNATPMDKEGPWWLADLKPGDAFRRENGTNRLVVSPDRVDRCGKVYVYCYNLDGNTDGYWMSGDTSVIPVTLSSECKGEPCTPEPFYMCYVEGAGAPTRKHEASAVGLEAERLAKVTKRKVFVLKAMASVEYVVPTAASGHHWSDFALKEEK